MKIDNVVFAAQRQRYWQAVLLDLTSAAILFRHFMTIRALHYLNC
jgi:hypothetical protein